MRHFFEADKPVAQICHAPLALATAGVLKGRRTAAYPALASDVTQAGAEYVDGAAVVDGLMVSARAWPDHPSWMRGISGGTTGQGPGDLTLAPHRYRGTTVTGPRVPGAARSLTFLALFAAAVTEGRFG